MELTINLDEMQDHVEAGQCELVAEFLTVYANPTRIRILCALRGERRTVTELADAAGVSLQNMSQHLRVMRDKGAVVATKEGQRVYYSVADPKFLYGMKLIHDALMEQLQRRAAESRGLGAPRVQQHG